MNNIVKQGQCFLDKVIQLTGSYESALELSLDNNVSITAIAGDSGCLVGSYINSNIIANKQVANFFNKNVEPATTINIDQLEAIGIGNMIIENTFIIG